MLCFKVQLKAIDLLIIIFTKNGVTTPEVGQADVAETSSIPVLQNDQDYE